VKKVLYMFYELGMTIAEIAEELSMSESNVKHKLYRTLKEVRDSLK
jgi:DNA-directed RNA polymerase specialized sigma24 family protein